MTLLIVGSYKLWSTESVTLIHAQAEHSFDTSKYERLLFHMYVLLCTWYSMCRRTCTEKVQQRSFARWMKRWLYMRIRGMLVVAHKYTYATQTGSLEINLIHVTDTCTYACSLMRQSEQEQERRPLTHDDDNKSQAPNQAHEVSEHTHHIRTKYVRDGFQPYD